MTRARGALSLMMAAAAFAVAAPAPRSDGAPPPNVLPPAPANPFAAEFDTLVREEIKKLVVVLGYTFDANDHADAVAIARASKARKPMEELFATLKRVGVLEERIKNAVELGAKQIAWATLLQMYQEKHRAVNKPPPAFTEPYAGGVLDDAGTVSPKPTDRAGANSNRDEAMKAAAQMIGAMLCIYQPAICPFVTLFLASMGSGEGLAKDIELLNSIAESSRTGNWPPDLAGKIGERMKDLNVGPRAGELAKAIGELSNLPPDEAVAKLLKEAVTKSDVVANYMKNLPSWAEPALALVTGDKPLADLLDAIPNDPNPHFKSAEEKERFRVAFEMTVLLAGTRGAQWKARYWDAPKGLGSLPVKP